MVPGEAGSRTCFRDHHEKYTQEQAVSHQRTRQMALADSASERLEKNSALLEPFVRWLQARFLDEHRLKRIKVNYTSPTKNYVILSDKGKRIKLSDPISVWAKVAKLSEDRIAIEVVDLTTKRRILLSCDKTEFPFELQSLDGDFGFPVERDEVEEDALLAAAQGYKLGLSGGLPVIDRIQEMLPVSNRGTAESEDTTSDTEQTVDGDVVMEDSDDTPAQETTYEAYVQQTTQMVDHEIFTRLSRQTVSLQAQLLVQRIEIEQLLQQLNSPKKETRDFSIQDYVLRKVVTGTYNGHIYGVERLKTGTIHSLKEVVINEADLNAEEAIAALARELSVMKSLQQAGQVSPHVLQFESAFFENTPLRSSCYILTAPTALSFRDFTDTLSAPRNVFKTVAFQTLEGLRFLHQHTSCIHGNLNFDNIVVSFSGAISISSFSHAFRINDTVEATELKSDPQSSSYRLPELQRELEAITVKPAIDIAAAGLILYRLLTRKDLYSGEESELSRDTEEEHLELIKPFLVPFTSELTVEEVLKWNMFNVESDGQESLLS